MKYALFLISLVTINAHAETRGEYQDREDLKNPYIYNSRRNQQVSAADKDVRNQVADKNKPGFYQLRSEQIHSDSEAATVINAHTSPVSFDNILILKFVCSTGLNELTIPVKFENVKWDLVNKNLKSDLSNGSIQTDPNGIAKIHFKSSEPIRDQKIKVEVKTTKKEFALGVGPYEVLLNEKDCSQR
jgi:hypothetical protein